MIDGNVVDGLASVVLKKSLKVHRTPKAQLYNIPILALFYTRSFNKNVLRFCLSTLTRTIVNIEFFV